MVDNIATKLLGLVLIVRAHMVINDPRRMVVNGIAGDRVTLQFTVNGTTNKKITSVAIYTTGQRKIAQCPASQNVSEDVSYKVNSGNVSVFFHISKLTLNHSEIYSASLFLEGGRIPKESTFSVQLIVREDNSSRPTTESPMPTNSTNSPKYCGSSSIAVTVVSSVVALAAILSCFIWCLVRSKDKQQQSPNPTVQETPVASNEVPATSVVYSVLDFPKRPPAVLKMDPNDTEYAAVTYDNTQV